MRGSFALTDQDGNEIDFRGATVALCRCGRSRRKPFCDGTHKATSWRAASGAQQHPQVVDDSGPRLVHDCRTSTTG